MYKILTLHGVVGKMQKNYFPKEEGREGGEKSACSAPQVPGLKPRIYRVLDKSPQLHATIIV